MTEIIRFRTGPVLNSGIPEKHIRETALDVFSRSLLSGEQLATLRKGDKIINSGIKMTGLPPTDETYNRIEGEYPGYIVANNLYWKNHLLLNLIYDKGGVQ